MRLDARIPVQVVASEQEPPPSGDTALLRLGAGGTDGRADGRIGDLLPTADLGWVAVRRLPETAIGGHGASCACCTGRSGLAEALGLLFAQRARAEVPWFSRVVLTARAEHLHDVVTILRDDVLVSGRFRLSAEK